MSYTKTEWKDRLPSTEFVKITRSDGTVVEYSAKIEEVSQPSIPGTPVNAANMNKIENGIAEADNTANSALMNANNATGIANSALGTAQSAQNTANSAQTTANSAQTTATEAQNTASIALTRSSSRTVEVLIATRSEVLTVGNGKADFVVPHTLANWKLSSAHASVIDGKSTSGKPTVRLMKNETVSLLNTLITIDENEQTSYTAAIQPVINTAAQVVTQGDLIRVDVTVAGTGTKGLLVIMEFKP